MDEVIREKLAEINELLKGSECNLTAWEDGACTEFSYLRNRLDLIDNDSALPFLRGVEATLRMLQASRIRYRFLHCWLVDARALCASKTQWFSGESQWLAKVAMPASNGWKEYRGVYLKEGTGYVYLCVTGTSECMKFLYLSAEGWKELPDMVSRYNEWEEKVQVFLTNAQRSLFLADKMPVCPTAPTNS